MPSQQENNTQAPELSIAEKAATEYFDTSYPERTFEPAMLVHMIHNIIGENRPLNTRTPTKPSDELAGLLIGLLRAGVFHESSNASVREAIECCFLHSPVYQLALKLYYLEHEHLLTGQPTAYEALQKVIDQALTPAHPNATRASDHVETGMQMPEERPVQVEPASGVQSVIRARRFELIDEDGNLAAELETIRGIMGEGRRTIFSMKGANRRVIQMVSDTQSGEMAFNILQGGDFYPVRFGILDDRKPNPTLEIGGKDKGKAAYMRLSVDNDLLSPAIRLYDRKDKLRAVLQVQADGTPIFETYEPKAKKGDDQHD